MDQTRFRTLQSAMEVATELYPNAVARRVKGDSFTVSLITKIPFAPDEEKPFDIIVDRIPSERKALVHKFPNGDRVVGTTARLSPEGETFKIDVIFCLGDSHGARVIVSNEMERIIRDGFGKEMDSFFDTDPEQN